MLAPAQNALPGQRVRKAPCATRRGLGADVAVNFLSHDVDAQEVCSTIKTLGRRALAVQADVSKASEVSRLVETVQRELGGIGILVNNAAIRRPQRLDDITEKDWDAGR